MRHNRIHTFADILCILVGTGVDAPEKGPARYLPDPAVPMTSGFSLPDEALMVAMQQNLSLICEVYVPHGTPPGIQEGKLTVQAGGDVLEIDVALEIRDFTLPDKLSFVPEMNAYGTVNPFDGYDYYRLAHRHRTWDQPTSASGLSKIVNCCTGPFILQNRAVPTGLMRPTPILWTGA